MESLVGADVLRHISDYYNEEDVNMLINQILADDVGVSSSNVDVNGWQMVDGIVTFSGAWLPHWVLHPVHASVQILLQVEEWHLLGYLPSGLQALWMNAVIPTYIQDYSVHSQRFVKDAVTEIKALVSRAQEYMVPPLVPKLVGELYEALMEHPPTVMNLISQLGGRCHTNVTVVDGLSSLGAYETHTITFSDIKLIDDIMSHDSQAIRRKVALLPLLNSKVTVAKWLNECPDWQASHISPVGDEYRPSEVSREVEFLDDLKHSSGLLKSNQFTVRRLGPRDAKAFSLHWTHQRCVVFIHPVLSSLDSLVELVPHPKDAVISARACGDAGVLHYHPVVKGLSRGKYLRLRLSKIWKALYPASHPADESHTRIYLDEAVKTHLLKQGKGAENEHRLNKSLGVLPVGTTSVWVTNQVLWAAFTPTAIRVWKEVSDFNVCWMYDLGAAKVMKVLENVYRRTARWLTGENMSMIELGHIVGVPLMTGRARHTADWVAERENRCRPESVVNYVHPTTSDHLEGLVALEAQLSRIMRPLVSRNRLEGRTWSDYVRAAQNWLSPGSVGGAKVEYAGTGESPLQPGSLNKRSFLEHVPSAILDRILYDSDAEMIASGSEKWENGKGRAIFGTMLIDYLVFGYVLGATDPLMPAVQWCETGDTGYKDIRNTLCRLHHIRTSRIDASMADYADFNRQHMLVVLSLCYKTLKKICKEAGVKNEDFYVALDWCANAISNCYTYFPDGDNSTKSYRILFEGNAPDGRQYKLKKPTSDNDAKVYQGMFSGHRGTSSDNTILNIAYMDVAAAHVAEKYGVSPINLHRVHTGDDIWMTISNRLYSALVYDTMIKQGMVLQAVKQLFSRRGEFLRVLYTKEGMQGYLCRAISARVTSALQNASDADIVARIDKIRTTCATCYRRGADVESLMILQEMLVVRANKITIKTNGGVVRSSIPLISLEKSYVVGGIDYGPPGTFANDWSMLGDLPRLPSGKVVDIDKLPHHTAASQAQIDRSRMDISNTSTSKLQDAYHEQNFSKCVADETLAEERLGYAGDVGKWRRKVEGKQWKRTYKPRLAVVTLCNRQDYAKYWLNCDHDGEFDATWRAYIPHKDDWSSTPTETPLCRIDRAIRSGAFRDIATVEKLFDGPKIELVKHAIMSCRNKHLVATALGAVTLMETSLSSCDAARVICGMPVDGASMSWLLPDSVLSYLSNVIVTAVINSNSRKRRYSLGKWGEDVSRASRRALSYIAKNTNWLELGCT